MILAERYEIPISKLVPKNEEQKKCIEKLRVFFDWEQAVDTSYLYRQYNPASMNPVPFFWNSDPENKKWKLLYEEGVKTMKVITRSPPWCLSIIGTVGNGKSTLACGLIAEVRSRTSSSFKCLYCTQREITDSYKQNFDQNIYQKYATADLLVIDELTNMSDYDKGLIESILNERYMDNRKTILIGNIPTKDYSKFFDEHITSRLREGLTMVMKEPDMRKKFEWEEDDET